MGLWGWVRVGLIGLCPFLLPVIDGDAVPAKVAVFVTSRKGRCIRTFFFFFFFCRISHVTTELTPTPALPTPFVCSEQRILKHIHHG